MKPEQWEYIINNWGSSDPLVQQEIASMKDKDAEEFNNLNAQLDDRNKKIQELTQQNTEVNRLNMAMVLRLTDPNNQGGSDDEDGGYIPPDVDDYERFIKKR